jgi:hypothetical protein
MFGNNNCLCIILLVLLFCTGGCCGNNGDNDEGVEGIFENDALMALLIGAVLGCFLCSREITEDLNCQNNNTNDDTVV